MVRPTPAGQPGYLSLGTGDDDSTLPWNFTLIQRWEHNWMLDLCYQVEYKEKNMLGSIDLRDRSSQLAIAAAATGVLGAGYLLHRSLRKRQTAIPNGPYGPETLPKDAYDAVIVGAGPSGSVCGYFMAKEGAKVALLDKETFPREKICGDAVCTPAIHILKEMDVIDGLIAEGKAKYADSGGFVSPCGLSYIGNSVHELGESAACAIKRYHLDNAVAKKAQEAGANLMEKFEVGDDVTFDEKAGLWTVKSVTGDVVKGRVLVCADGATSRLATRLGLCNAAPMGVSSRAYISNHNTDFDGACFYPKWSLPGYAAIFRHADGELGYCYYLIPAGKNAAKGQLGAVTADDLKRLHEEGIKYDPFISRAMGPQPKCQRMKAGSLRVGGQGVPKTYADHIIIVGDAAGHIDPLTGEGIHTAMLGGKIAGLTLLEARKAGNFSSSALKKFEESWMERYGHDFYWSQAFAEAIYRCPILMDAVANETQRTGDKFMSVWAEVATCMRPKTDFFRPNVAIPLTFALMREFWSQKIMGKNKGYRMPENMGGKTMNGKA